MLSSATTTLSFVIFEDVLELSFGFLLSGPNLPRSTTHVKTTKVVGNLMDTNCSCENYFKLIMSSKNQSKIIGICVH